MDHFEVEDSKEPALPSGVATTFVPGRNILFFTIAANRAYVHNVDSIVVGVAQQDYGGYPDCRQDFISKLEAALVSGLDRRLEIVTPLMNMTKKETVELAQSLPGCLDALAYSTTCYEGHFPPCGKCHSCVLRAKGFAEAGVNDPLLERAAVAISKV
ncbi:MAG: 7-cyano-7-deazaguanine synthase [bacterium ADurb.Bin425]|nr:MAG: 7-cyano-7-deazaguanine synthase [bacterium ADurb.Bin425]